MNVRSCANRWAHILGKVIFTGDNEKGGNFAAFEQTDVLAGDLRKMFGKGGGAFGIVWGA